MEVHLKSSSEFRVNFDPLESIEIQVDSLDYFVSIIILKTKLFKFFISKVQNEKRVEVIHLLVNNFKQKMFQKKLGDIETLFPIW